jgi:enoyl-CoA hydratase/carnithine racemase
MAELIRIDNSDYITTVTLNRPEAMNAINVTLALEIVRVMDEIAHDDQSRVIILCSSSERAFSVGADLKERQGLTPQVWQRQRIDLMRSFRVLGDCRKPILALVDGFALGGGCELALQCDFIYAGERAQFALPEARVGIIPGGGGTQLLPKRVGMAMAKELIFTGRRIDASEALRIGLVNRVVPSDQLMDAGRAVAREILQCAPISVRQAKRAINKGSSLDFETGWALEEEAYMAALYSEDRAEGMAAFREKRPAAFKDR